jgi:glycosyltransferase involved in cell wall biosynthesis
MGRGGVEMWLLEVFRHVDRSQVEMDVLVQSSVPGALDDEARRLGVSIIQGAPASHPGSFGRRLLDVLRSGSGYDVVHSHMYFFSAYTLAVARHAGVPVRVAHSHADESSAERSAGAIRRLHLATARRTLRAVATHRIAASMPAGRALFGTDWPGRRHDRVLHYGFDFSRFDDEVDAAAVRRDLGIPPRAFVIGHVGRFDEAKNQAFLVDVMTVVAEQDPDAVLLLIGDGPLRPAVEEQVDARRLADRVFFAGPRADVPDIMRAAMDVLVLPSRHEGLGIVGLEAQAAGLPCLFSDAVPREVSVVPALTRFLSLRDPIPVWARAVLEAREHPQAGHSRVPELMASSFNIHTCLDALAEIYTCSPEAARGITGPKTGAVGRPRSELPTADGGTAAWHTTGS